MDGLIGAIVITRIEKAFAAGTDNKEIQDNIYPSIIKEYVANMGVLRIFPKLIFLSSPSL